MTASGAVGTLPVRAMHDFAAGSVVVSPAPGSRTASAGTQLSFLGASARRLRPISVTGSRSGSHGGRLRNYSGGGGASFLPSTPFVPGETVTVHVPLRIVGAASGTFRFVVGQAVPVSGAVQHHYRTTGPGVLSFASEPSIAPPQVSVAPTAGTASEGDYFLSPKGSAGQPGPMILNASGQLVWFHRLAEPNEYAMNFSMQSFAGKPVLTWWQGNIVAAHGQGEDVIMNSSYRTVAVVRGGNGFLPDLHDFQLTGSRAWVTSYQALHWNLTSVGGLANGIVWDGIVQEIDVKTGLVMFEWHSLDHVPVSDSEFTTSADPNSRLDYSHVNSIDVLSPDEIVVSARNTSAIYDISVAAGGTVQWQLGGKESTFALGPGVRFYLQHDVRVRSDGTITIFDNDATPVHGPSKALVVRLDRATKQATLVKSIIHRPPLIGAALGNVETLPGGNLLVSWGTTPYFDEYTSSGALLYEGRLVTGDDSYRVFRSPWSATPATPPQLALRRLPNGDLEGFASWNGATDVANWRVLSGPSPTSLKVVTTVPRSGFETTISLPRSASAGSVVAQALDPNGVVLRTSRVTTIRA
jgi:hypothetical protein